MRIIHLCPLPASLTDLDEVDGYMDMSRVDGCKEGSEAQYARGSVWLRNGENGPQDGPVFGGAVYLLITPHAPPGRGRP